MSDDATSTLPGEQLRAAREAAGLTQEDIAAKLKLSPRQISAIETGDWNALPERTFTRGFMRSYARLVSLDPDSLGLDQSASQPHAATELKPTPEAIGEIAHEAQRRSAKLARWLVPAALSAVLVAGVVYVQWDRLVALTTARSSVSTPAAVSATGSKPATTENRATEASATQSGAVIAPASSALPPATTPASAAPDSTAPAPALTPTTTLPALDTTAAAPPVVAPAPAPTLLPALTAGQKRITLTFKGKSWTEVRSKGEVIFSETAQPGTREFAGTPPLSFTVGNASNVAVAIDGKPYDMTELTRNDVARFRIE